MIFEVKLGSKINKYKEKLSLTGLLLAILMICLNSLAFGDEKLLFSEAQTAFTKGLSQSGSEKQLTMLKAAKLFETIVEDHRVVNGFVFYNIGNAYYEAGEPGKAVLYYQRAKRLIPGSVDLEYNLNLVRQELNIPKAEDSWWDGFKKGLLFWHFMLAYHTRKIAFLGFFALFWAMLTIMIFKRHLLIKAITILMFIGSIGMGGSYFVSAFELHLAETGVLIDHEVEARKGPSKSYEKYFEEMLPGGTEFKRLDEQGDWWKIELLSGDQCWVKEEVAELI